MQPQTLRANGATCLIALTLVSLAGIGQLLSATENPVTMRASLGKEKQGSKNRALNLIVNIKPGWHLYDALPQGSSETRTTVEFETPKGITKVGKITRPIGIPYPTKPGTRVYQVTVIFSQEFEIAPDFSGGKIEVKLNYQVCNNKSCQPPDTLKTSIQVPATTKAKDDTKSLFAEPELLKVGKNPLNKTAKQMYPSPAMFDIDNDGQIELVVGDIFGSLFVYENQNDSGTGDPVWSEPEKLNSADGKPIKVKNW